jgi:cytochrome P450
MTGVQTARPSFTRFFARSTRANPYPLLREYRGHSPFLADNSTAVIARYRDCEQVLRDRSSSSDYRTILPDVLRPPEPYAFMFQDAPMHTINRRSVSAWFTRGASARWSEMIGRITDECLANVADRGGNRMDVVAEYAQIIPTQLAFHLLGIPAEDRPQVQRWVFELARFIDIFGMSTSDLTLAVDVNADVDRYFGQLLRRRRIDPGEDLLSMLATSSDLDDPGVTANLVQTCKLVAVAGLETTVNLIGNTLLALLRHPGQFEQVRDDPDLIPEAVEETLRYDPPFHVVYRRSAEPMVIRGMEIPAATRLMLLLGATGRDPEIHERPDEFDLGRADKRHLGFAAGPHFCLGAALARIEVDIAIRTFLARVRGPELVTKEPPYRRHVSLRGLSELAVTFAEIR